MMISLTTYPAHIRILADGTKEIQTVEEHLNNTATIAAQFGQMYGLEKAAYLLGIVHDAGKFSNAFKEYIEKAANHEKVTRGAVIHSFTGVRLILANHGRTSACTTEDVALEVLAYAVGAHHGLFDCVTFDDYSEKTRIELARRIYEEHPECDESMNRYYQLMLDEKSLSELILKATSEVNEWLKSCQKSATDAAQRNFLIGMTVRLLLSILIDADRQDTAGFMTWETIPNPFTVSDWLTVKEHANAQYREMTEEAKKTPVNWARQEIKNACVKNIGQMGNILCLNIPTGSGKTVTSLLASLELITEKRKNRFVYTAPLLSILEQNAADIRKYIGKDEAVLEHHSNVVIEEDDEDILKSHGLYTQNWSAPIIVTTMVQLLNTFFDGSTSSIRRFHALGNSVIVIDEVQAVPPKMLTLFNLTLSFLSAFCDTTFILCSATQPHLEKAEHPPLMPMQDLMPYQENIWAPFRRTKILNGYRMRLEEVPAFVEKIMADHSSLLVVCNKKKEAVDLLRQLPPVDAEIVHLSASMCVSHRRDVLERLQHLLEDKKRVLCIATQVIEAGVDISFDCAIRLAAGMDSVVQAAGRCNRHGEHHELSPVYLLDCPDERLTYLPEIENGKSATLDLLNSFQRTPDKYGNRLESDEAISAYYEILYSRMLPGSQDFFDRKLRKTIYKMLSDDLIRLKYTENSQHYYMAQAFKTAGKAFSVFEDKGTTVIVPWGKGAEIIEKLQSLSAYDVTDVQLLLRRARPYTVTVFDHQLRSLLEAGGIIELIDGAAYALTARYYDSQTGLRLPENQFLEV